MWYTILYISDLFGGRKEKKEKGNVEQYIEDRQETSITAFTVSSLLPHHHLSLSNASNLWITLVLH